MARSVGGLLGLLNSIGGKLIYSLIGEDAWNDTDNLNHLRPFFGGIILGLPLGVLLSFLWSWLLFFIVPFLLGTGGIALEELRREAKK